MRAAVVVAPVTLARVLGAHDPLPRRPRRVLVTGVSGVGKTTLVGTIGGVLGLPDTEIDSLFHGPGWVPRPAFLDDVRALIAEPLWVTEWQYSEARPMLLDRADLLIWLDLPFWRVTLPRVALRTIRRRLRREVLWNGNREAPLRTFFTDPDHIVRWAVKTRGNYVARLSGVARDNPDVAVVRLRSPGEVAAWIGGPLQASAQAGR